MGGRVAGWMDRWVVGWMGGWLGGRVGWGAVCVCVRACAQLDMSVFAHARARLQARVEVGSQAVRCMAPVGSGLGQDGAGLVHEPHADHAVCLVKHNIRHP